MEPPPKTINAALSKNPYMLGGALFTLFTLLTGGFWGKPMWGTFWVWDEYEVFISYFGPHGSGHHPSPIDTLPHRLPPSELVIKLIESNIDCHLIFTWV
jgi:hypothetical protein